ncbi:hypothetical protein EGW08_019885 [Elysia chlorotica]|uniref:Uncharacterized protein n=1 Tax=Elysia chlorotica TaxID=188477 RepID=A0A433ST75_ELYCH|nr:hypothetical protein EGW08_019885 [Elysia chlorotica]
MGSGPDSATHATQKLEGFISEFSKPVPEGYTQPPTTSSYITNDIKARTLSLTTYDVPSVAPTSLPPTTAAGGPQGFLPLSESYTGKLNRPSNPQHVARTPSAEERATLLSNAVLPGNLEAQTSKPNLEHPLSTLPDTHPPTSGTELRRTTASPVSHTPDSTVANETASQKNNIPGHSSFPTFFEGSPSGSAQEPSTDKALNRMVHRVFHPMEAFQMHPRP